MPVKKKTAKKTVKKKKGLGLFDHIRHINQVQKPNYFTDLSPVDKSSWSNWIIFRALSYNPEYVDIINMIQNCVGLKPALVYRLLIDIFPIDRRYHPFLKGKGRVKYGDELIQLISKHCESSEAEAIGYLDTFSATKEGKEALREIVSLYGMTDKEIKNILKR